LRDEKFVESILHSYRNSSKYTDRQAPDAMIARVLEMKDALTAGGLSIGLCDGKSWQNLCGTKDILAPVTNGFTIHIEMDEAVRSHDRVLVNALTRVFADLSTNPAKCFQKRRSSVFPLRKIFAMIFLSATFGFRLIFYGD
jgi:hypothetical protein